MQWLEQALARGKGFINAISSGIQHYAPRQIHMRHLDQLARQGRYRDMLPSWSHPDSAIVEGGGISSADRIRLLPQYVAQYTMPQHARDIPPAASAGIPPERLVEVMRLSQEMYPLAWASMPTPLSMPAARPVIERPVNQTVTLASESDISNAYAEMYPDAQFGPPRAYFDPLNRRSLLPDIDVIRINNAQARLNDLAARLSQQVSYLQDTVDLGSPEYTGALYDSLEPKPVAFTEDGRSVTPTRSNPAPKPKKKPGPKKGSKRRTASQGPAGKTS